MLESIRQYFQDWSDACEYANECAPDLHFLGNGEPFTALLTIAAVCGLVYAINETRIKQREAARLSAAPAHAGDAPAGTPARKPAPQEKLAA